MATPYCSLGFFKFRLITVENLKQCLRDLNMSIEPQEPLSSSKYAEIVKWFGYTPNKAIRLRIQMMLKRNIHLITSNSGNVSADDNQNAKVKLNTGIHTTGDMPNVAVKPNTGKHSADAFKVKSNLRVNNADDVQNGAVKPNTGKHSADREQHFRVKTNIRINSADALQNVAVKPNTGKHSAEGEQHCSGNPISRINSASARARGIPCVSAKLNSVKSSLDGENSAFDSAGEKIISNVAESSADRSIPFQVFIKNTNYQNSSCETDSSSLERETLINSANLSSMSQRTSEVELSDSVILDEDADSSSSKSGAEDILIQLQPSACNDDSFCENAEHEKPEREFGMKKSHVKRNIFIGSCEIDSEDWLEMWNGTELVPDEYTDPLSNAFFKVEPRCAPLYERNIPWKSVAGQPRRVTVLAHCGQEMCRKFRLIITIAEGCQPTLEVYASSNTLTHGIEPVSRPLKGRKRLKMYSDAKLLKPSALREQSTHEAHFQPMQDGNAQGVKSCSVYRKVRQEARAEGRIHPDPFFDLVLRRREQEKAAKKKKKDTDGKEPSVQFIHLVTDPLMVCIFCENRLLLFKLAMKELAFLVLHLDSTGGVVRKVFDADKRIYYYAIVYSYKDFVLPVTEFISCKNKAREVGLWFTEFLAFAEEHGLISFPPFMVVDCTYASLNAIVKEFNGMKMYHFLQVLYSFVSGDRSKKWVKKARRDYVIPHLCYSHFMHLMGGTIKDYYSISPGVISEIRVCSSSQAVQGEQLKTRKTNRKTVPDSASVKVDAFKKETSKRSKKLKLSRSEYKHVRGNLMDFYSLFVQTHSYSELQSLFRHFFTLLLFSVDCIVVKTSIDDLNKFVQKKEASCPKEFIEEKVESPSTSQLGQKTEEQECEVAAEFFDIDFSDPKVKYKSNPFYIDIEKIFANVLERHDKFLKENKGKFEKNVFYNPAYALHILTYFAHIIPLWTGILLPKGTRLDNSVVENFFFQVKHILMNSERNAPLSTFVYKINNNFESKRKLILCNVPKEGLAGHKRNAQNNTGPNEKGISVPPSQETLSAASENQQSEAEEDCTMVENKDDNLCPSNLYSYQVEEKWSKRGTFGSRTHKYLYSNLTHLKHLRSCSKPSLSEPTSQTAADIKGTPHHSGDKTESSSDVPLKKPRLTMKNSHLLEGELQSVQKVTNGLNETPAAETRNVKPFEKLETVCNSSIARVPLSLAEVEDSESYSQIAEIVRVEDQQLEANSLFVVNENDLHAVNTSDAGILRSPPEVEEMRVVGLGVRDAVSNSKELSVVSNCRSQLESCQSQRTKKNIKRFNFRTVISLLQNSHTSFEMYISSVLLTNCVVQDVDYYSSVSSVSCKDHTELDYLVCRSETVTYPGLYQLTFSEFSTLDDFRFGRAPRSFWLTGWIIDAVCGTLLSLSSVDRNKVFICTLAQNAMVYNGWWPKDEDFPLPPSAELLIMPYSEGATSPLNQGIHWCLVLVDLKRYQFFHFDPYKGCTTQAVEQLKQFLHVLSSSQKQVLSQCKWSFPSVTFPAQKDGFNCGVFVLYFIHCILKQQPADTLSFSPSFSPSEYRRFLRHLLLSNSGSVYNYCFTCRTDYDFEKSRYDSLWISCDVCSRSCHITPACINDKTVNAEDFLDGSRKKRDAMPYICYLCKINKSKFKVSKKMQLLQGLQKIHDKYFLHNS